jgi:hypothetical protein
MVQMYMQNYSRMLQQMGASIDTQKQINHRGQQGQLIGATMRNPQMGGTIHSMIVFLPGPGLVVQVMGPEQNRAQLGNVLGQMLDSLQY